MTPGCCDKTLHHGQLLSLTHESKSGLNDMWLFQAATSPGCYNILCPYMSSFVVAAVASTRSGRLIISSSAASSTTRPVSQQGQWLWGAR